MDAPEIKAAMTEMRENMEFLSRFVGEAFGMIVMEDPIRRVALDSMLAHWDGLASKYGVGQQVMQHLRQGADPLLANGRRLFPNSDGEFPLMGDAPPPRRP